MDDLAQTIRSIPIFSGLSREDIAKILGKMEERSFGGGTTIFSQGDKGDAFYLIQSGAVQVVLQSAGGRSEAIAVLGPQEWFGEMALLSGEPRSATILTVKETTLLKLSRAAWDELIEKHPTWLLHFCAALSKRLSLTEQQYSIGRDAFTTLAEEFYSSRPLEEQQFLRHISLLGSIQPETVENLLQARGAAKFLTNLERSRFPMIRPVADNGYELHSFFKEFLVEKFLATEGRESILLLHAHLSSRYETLEAWDGAIHHRIEASDWPEAIRLIIAHKEPLLSQSAAFLKNSLEQIPPDYSLSDFRLVHIKAEVLAHLGDFGAAIRTYQDVLSKKGSGTLGAEDVTRYQRMAASLMQKKHYAQALNCLRSALNLVDRETTTSSGEAAELQWKPGKPDQVASLGGMTPALGSIQKDWLSLSSRLRQQGSLSRWIGGVLGFVVFAYLWFGSPDIALEPSATKQLALLCLTLIYWIFMVLPDYGVALIFALGLILTRLASPDIALGGFASTTWFMTLGVLGLGAAITGSGLFYRLSLQLVRFFPLSYYWQIIALGFMGVVVMALIPQQSARTAIISQMLVNLSESLGYKSPSKASTGFFAASFLGLGQLCFLFLTGSTTSLIAWGLLPSDVRAQFTWGYWFLAALPPTLVIFAIMLASIIFLYRPESQPAISYKMVQTQLDILGPLSYKEWISLGVLCFTVTGWLTITYHGIDGAWISLVAFCVLINTGVLGWGMVKKGIDWELLIYMGVTLSIPTLLTQAKIDQWLVELISPLIVPYLNSPALFFVIIALLTYVLKLLFTSFLAVVTLSVALIPLSIDMEVSPWIIAMLILMASEVWFFRFQVDWHTLANSTTEGKGFSYPLMYRINPFYALAYIVGLIVAIPYWRYLGLMG